MMQAPSRAMAAATSSTEQSGSKVCSMLFFLIAIGAETGIGPNFSDNPLHGPGGLCLHLTVLIVIPHRRSRVQAAASVKRPFLEYLKWQKRRRG